MPFYLDKFEAMVKANGGHLVNGKVSRKRLQVHIDSLVALPNVLNLVLFTAHLGRYLLRGAPELLQGPRRKGLLAGLPRPTSSGQEGRISPRHRQLHCQATRKHMMWVVHTLTAGSAR